MQKLLLAYILLVVFLIHMSNNLCTFSIDIRAAWVLDLYYTHKHVVISCVQIQIITVTLQK